MAKDTSNGIREFVKNALKTYYDNFLVKLSDNANKDDVNPTIKLNNDGSVYIYDIGGYDGISIQNVSTLLKVINSAENNIQDLSTHAIKNIDAGNNIKIEKPSNTTTKISTIGYLYNEEKKSFAEGSNGLNLANGLNSHAEGLETTASVEASHAEGFKTVASGVRSHAEGYLTTASGTASHAEGYRNTVVGEMSHVEGGDNKIYSKYGHAEGASNTIGELGVDGTSKGYKSHAEGSGNTVTGNGSHAEGINNTVSGNNAHAEGQSNIVSNTNAHAEGKSNQSIGLHAHTEGLETQATGANSHSEGLLTVASGSKTHAEGWYTIARNDCEHASGMYNKTNYKDANAQTIFSIGIGTSDTDRKNAIEVLRNGQVLIKGIGGYDGTNPFDCNFGGIVCLTLGNSMDTAEIEKNIKVLQDILTNKKHYILTIYDTVEDKFFGDCEVVQSGTNSVNIISNYLSTTLSGYTIYYSFKTDTKEYTRNKYSITIPTKASVDKLQQSKADYENGEMAEEDCHAWYTQDQGLLCKMEALYSLIGDICMLSISNMQVLGGWSEMFYSLPVPSVVPCHGVYKSSVGQMMYYSTTYRNEIAVLRVAPLATTEQIIEDNAGSSLVITFKYK